MIEPTRKEPMNTDAKNPLLSFDATPLERITALALIEAMDSARKTARDARLLPAGFDGRVVVTRILADFLAGAIAGAEDDHETLGEDVKNWMRDGLEFWRAEVAEHKAEQETTAAKLSAEFGKLFGGL